MTPHPLADLFPILGRDDLQALAADIAANGLHHPILIYNAQVLDGRNRLAACQLANVEPAFETFTGTEAEALALVLSLNLTRRHLSTAQKAALAVSLLPIEEKAARGRQGARTDLHPAGDEGAHGQALELAGRRVGISKNSVWRASKIATDALEVFAAMKAGIVRTVAEGQRLAQLPQDRRTQVLTIMRDQGISMKEAQQTPKSYTRTGGSTEWYTPVEVIDLARRVLGGPISLDPASSEEAQLYVQADHYFTVEDDGLAHAWGADRLWLNPPYGYTAARTSMTEVWLKKLLAEVAEGRTKRALLLVRAATEANWFQPLWDYPLCFIRGRLDFIPGPGTKRGTEPTVASVIAGVGVDHEVFYEGFSGLGRIVLPGSGRSTTPRRLKHPLIFITLYVQVSSLPTWKKAPRREHWGA